jgi:hypothetical protein
VAEAYDTVFSDAIGSIDSRSEASLPLSRLTNEISDVADRYGQQGVGNRASNRVRAAMRYSQVIGEDMTDWTALLRENPVVNVSIGHLNQRSRNLTVGATARMLQVLRQRDRVPPFVFVLDEAHFFLPPGGDTTPSSSVIREMVRTARHHAIGAILVTQSPSSLDKQVLLMCNTKLTFALEREDLRTLKGTMSDLPEKVVERIPKLPQGDAILSSGRDLVRHAARISIRSDRQTAEGSPTPNLMEEVKRWRQQD